ncbi:MAG: phosphate ABC transporter permease subunit PstC [Rickettsiales bacterium]|jgi:phosphate transport system permease protein|nr:phosphate ABC transporter permease subunit PstC [Rickettsiales bacterium]
MLLLCAFLFSLFCYHIAKKRIIFLSSRYRIKTRSLPEYYGINIATWNLSASILAILTLHIFTYFGYVVNEVYGYLAIMSITTILVIYIFAALRGKFRAQMYFELTLKKILNVASLVSILLTLSILFTILFEACQFFNIIPIEDFLLGLKWSPQDHGQNFGVIPVLSGTLLITAIAMFIAIPLGLLSAIYLTEYTTKKTRDIIKPILEILAGIPTIVYGYFAILIMGPAIRMMGEALGLEVSTESALAAGLVMGIMITPFILSLSDDAITAVPQNLRDAALALGSTRAEMIVKVVLPSASSGIISAVLLAISRAIGETMIVVMAAGINAKLTFNPLEAVTTFTAQIVALLVGDQEFDSPKTLSAFALALALFIITLFLNIWALIIIKRNRKRYE